MITITDRQDGFGAQFQHIIFGMMYAELNHKTYIHKPITQMAHNYNGNPNFVDEIEDFLNIKNHYQTTREVEHVQSIDFWSLYNFITADFNDCIRKTKTLEKIRHIFWENKTSPYSSERCNIAVHIRRPNMEDDRIEGADTPDEYYLNRIEKIRRDEDVTKGKIFHIFSQNTLDRTKYDQPDIVLHIDEDIRTTFLGLVAADILISSKSALSYCAGLLSVGRVYAMPFHSSLNPMKDGWILE